MIAPYWEDLSPQRTNSGRVWQWFDEANHRLIVEYNHIEQYAPTGSFETFQVILFDPEHYSTTSGDGRILFQYKDMSVTAQSEGTVGIENAAENDGLQYLFDGDYDTHAHPITDGFAILCTMPTSTPSMELTLTPYNPPIQIPAGGGTFDYNIAVENTGSTGYWGSVWCTATLPSGSEVVTLGPVSLFFGPGFSGDRDRMQTIPGRAPAGDYTYNGYVGIFPVVVWASDSFPFTKLTTGYNGTTYPEWANDGEPFEDWFTTGNEEAIPRVYSLGQNYPNPFNPLTTIHFALPEDSHVKLAVYDLMGRQVALLVNGNRQAGAHEVAFRADALASGLYLYRIEAGDFTAVRKLVVIK
jgi:hypothetical protein